MSHSRPKRATVAEIGAKPVTIARTGAAPLERIVLIGASTGGIDALLTVLAAYPADGPPTAIVQHTGQGYSDSLVRVLSRGCAAKVVAAQDGMVLDRGMVCVAAGTIGHLRLIPGDRLRCSLAAGPVISGHVPSVDALFRSALPVATRVIAVLLTGMGSDGAAGMLELSRAGSMTIGQDEGTSVVYGMPRVAFNLGAVRRQLPLPVIGATIMGLCAPRVGSPIKGQG